MDVNRIIHETHHKVVALRYIEYCIDEGNKSEAGQEMLEWAFTLEDIDKDTLLKQIKEMISHLAAERDEKQNMLTAMTLQQTEV